MALLSVVLAGQLADRLPGAADAGEGLAAAQWIPPQARAQLAPAGRRTRSRTRSRGRRADGAGDDPGAFLPRETPPLAAAGARARGEAEDGPVEV